MCVHSFYVPHSIRDQNRSQVSFSPIHPAAPPSSPPFQERRGRQISVSGGTLDTSDKGENNKDAKDEKDIARRGVKRERPSSAAASAASAAAALRSAVRSAVTAVPDLAGSSIRALRGTVEAELGVEHGSIDKAVFKPLALAELAIRRERDAESALAVAASASASTSASASSSSSSSSSTSSSSSSSSSSFAASGAGGGGGAGEGGDGGKRGCTASCDGSPKEEYLPYKYQGVGPIPRHLLRVCCAYRTEQGEKQGTEWLNMPQQQERKDDAAAAEKAWVAGQAGVGSDKLGGSPDAMLRGEFMAMIQLEGKRDRKPRKFG